MNPFRTLCQWGHGPDRREMNRGDESLADVPAKSTHTPEVREFMAIGVITDEEVGQPSEIKEVLYAR